MPELPDIETYLEALSERILDEPLLRASIESPFLLRTADPPIRELEGKKVVGLRRLGKRIVLELEGGLFLVLHLMIAGRLHWYVSSSVSRGPSPPSAGEAVGASPALEPGRETADPPRHRAAPKRSGTPLASFQFRPGTLTLTEAGKRRRAALHLFRGEAGLASVARTGIEPLEVDLPAFTAALSIENHTLKRALTDPDLFSGIGNAYSDEILHQAGLSPVKLTQRMTAEEAARLFHATRHVLQTWLARLRQERAAEFPEKVTAFREDFSVHGKYRQPCPRCGAPVQRIVHADSETNYCPGCQTGGHILSDRSLARLLKQDWPRTLEQLEGKPGFGLKAVAGPRIARAPR